MIFIWIPLPPSRLCLRRNDRFHQRRKRKLPCQILHLRHAAGLTFKQIAEVLDEPLGTVLARQHRALAKLRRILDPDGADESDLEEEAIDGPHGR